MQQLILAKCISGVRIQYSHRYSQVEKKILTKKDGIAAEKRVGVCAAIFLVLEVIHTEVGITTPGHLQVFFFFLMLRSYLANN